MPNTAAAHIAPARIDKRDAMLVFGLSQHYTPQTMSGIPSQWEQFLPHFGHIPSQADKIAYGVIAALKSASSPLTRANLRACEFHPRPTLCSCTPLTSLRSVPPAARSGIRVFRIPATKPLMALGSSAMARSSADVLVWVDWKSGFRLCPDFPGAKLHTHLSRFVAFATRCVRISIQLFRLADDSQGQLTFEQFRKRPDDVSC
jgi:hypothetical protein